MAAPQGPEQPTIALPRGGGAVRGVGEKLGTSSATGTGTLSVPVTTSAGRAGFGPDLALHYDSGAGNGPFGAGWTLSVPSISRSTDRRLPRYDDAAESDVFLMSGYEDLVPVDEEVPAAACGTPEERDGHVVRRYRPRVEGFFARIERWTSLTDAADVHWRVLTRDDVLNVFGPDPASRVSDPADPRRTFSWFLRETRDLTGEVVLFDWVADDAAGIDTGATHERHRGPPDAPGRAADRYLKRIRYGNRTPLLDPDGRRPRRLDPDRLAGAGWMFEVVLDYGDHDPQAPTPEPDRPWPVRADPFSTYRPGFEVRTSRLCRRVLMFHHFPDEPGVGQDCLVRSTDLEHAHDPVLTTLTAVTHAGYRRRGDGYLRRALPSVRLGYTTAAAEPVVRTVTGAPPLVPSGAAGVDARWLDLHGDGVPGLLTRQGGAWSYARNLSPLDPDGEVRLAPATVVPTQPAAPRGDTTFLDLDGDGTLDLVSLAEPGSGVAEHEDAGWGPFRPFASPLTVRLDDPRVRLVDLSGDGRPDVLLLDEDGATWYPSLGHEGFAPARRSWFDARGGPRELLTERRETLRLADMTGDGGNDLVRIRVGEVSYWPNLGHGRFGAMVTMAFSPWLDEPDQFDPRRVVLGDVDGSGPVDLVYLHRDAVHVHANLVGNGWAPPRVLPVRVLDDALTSAELVDLRGNGTTCLVWSSAGPADAGRHLRYLDLVGRRKPYLLERTANGLGAETHLTYLPSTTFAVRDRVAGRPWLTRLPFPVQVVERVEVVERVSGNRFSTRYAYHHGLYDGVEREFRGFAMVEQWDTEEISAVPGRGEVDAADAETGTNEDEPWHLPPVHVRTWLHTGAWEGRDALTAALAALPAERGGMWREPAGDGARAEEPLAGAVLPAGLTPQEERDACRALRGSMLRREVFALDGSAREPYPYTVVEQSFHVRCLQRRGRRRHAVVLPELREVLTHTYERDPTDPRTDHMQVLETDGWGNVVREVAASYGRRRPDPGLPVDADREVQARPLVTCTRSGVTSALDDPRRYPDDHRAPLPTETVRWELTGLRPADGVRFRLDEWVGDGFSTGSPVEDLPAHVQPTHGTPQRRLLEHVRTFYRPDDLGAAAGDPEALLPLGVAEPRALRALVMTLALTPGLLASVLRRDGEPLVPDPGQTLVAEGRYVDGADLRDRGLLPGGRGPDGDGWWLPTGRSYFSPGPDDDAAAELAHAVRHFFRPRRLRDPFHRPDRPTETLVSYDAYDLLVAETRDALGNLTTVGERPSPRSPEPVDGHDYRVLEPVLVTDANGNRSACAHDALGLVVATAVMGKRDEGLGDSLEGVEPDLDEVVVVAHLADPTADAHALLGHASTRVVHDVGAFERSAAQRAPVAVSSIVRRTHVSDLAAGEQTPLEQRITFSDGLGRTVQEKALAEPGTEGAPLRWVRSGWVVVNNKGDPVRRFEPDFTSSPVYEADVRTGVSSVAFYDPLQRLVALVHPDETWEKTVVGAWSQSTWDVNDTVLSDPRTDPDAGPVTRGWFDGPAPPWRSWHDQRSGGELGPAEQEAARRAAAHAGTPGTAVLDPLGRTVLTLVAPQRGTRDATRVTLDVLGNRLAVRDAGAPGGRLVATYAHDLVGDRLHEASGDAGERWMLSDVGGRPLRAWDGRGHRVRTEHDVLGRPVRLFVLGADPARPEHEVMTERAVYGEAAPRAAERNLRGAVYRYRDQSGAATTHAKDFQGNVVRSSRRLARDYAAVLDWAGPVRLEGETHEIRTQYDALGRVVAMSGPGAPGGEPTVLHVRHNEAGLLRSVEADVSLPDGHRRLAFVEDVRYDAKGRRSRLRRGNGVVTDYRYDPLTFRPVRTVTRGPDGDAVQDLRYTYDPVGNVVRVDDDAVAPVFFRNRVVEATSTFAYDATYRLVEATGREHLAAGAPDPHGPSSGVRPLPHEADDRALARYVERYAYDAVGNLLRMAHRGSDAGHAGWTRHFEYGTDDDAELHGNRLLRSHLGGREGAETFDHDAHGNTTAVPHLEAMRWDYRDHLRMTRRQRTTDGEGEDGGDEGEGGERTWYVYDAAGARVRKVTEVAPGVVGQERIYLGAFEIHRRHAGTFAGLERTTLHVLDDRARVALVEVRNDVDDGSARTLVRHQVPDHVGSSAVEVDEDGRVLSREEWSPYGSTVALSWYARGCTPKRYRFAGKERDEESGFAYFGARYLAPWLGRWLSCDETRGDVQVPLSLHRYAYAHDNPVAFGDPDGRAINLLAAGIGAAVGAVGGAVVGAWNAEPGERWSGAAVGGGIGAVAGGLAGLTFGVSLAATGAVGVGGTAVAGGGTTGSVLISGTLAGAVGGGTSASAHTLAAGGSAEQALEMGAIGAFTGSLGGAAGAGSASFTSSVLTRAGTSQAVNFTVSGGVAGFTGDVTVQAASVGVGTQQSFSGTQLLVSTVGGGAGGALMSRVVPEPVSTVQQSPATTPAATSSAAAGTTTAPGQGGTPAPAATVPAPTAATSSGGHTPATPATTWRAHEVNVTSMLQTQNPGTVIGRQVTIDVTGPGPTGPRTVTVRVDNTVPTGASRLQVVDAKFSAVRDLSAPGVNLDSTVTPNQSTVYGWLRSGTPVSAVVRGARAEAAGYTPGQSVVLEPSVQMCVVDPAGAVVTRSY